MKRRFSAVVAGAGTLAATAGVVLLGATAAHAATSPPWEPDPSSVGTIAFYSAAGTQITSGNISDATIGAYAVGSAALRTTDNAALLNYAQPNPNQPTSGWNVAGITALASPYPNTSAPASIIALGATNPVVTEDPTLDTSLESDIESAPNTGTVVYADTASGCAYATTISGCTNTSYANIYQIRLLTTDGSTNSPKYDVADLQVDPATGDWTQVYPTATTPPPGTSTSTTVPSSSENPSNVGDSVAFSSTETASDSTHPAGSITFTVDGTAGTPITVDANGVATTAPTTTLAAGTHTVTAAFTPTASGYTASAPSAALTQTVNGPKGAATTTTSLAVSGGSTPLTSVSLTGKITASDGTTPAGTVAFTDNGTALATTPASATVDASGNYAATFPAGFADGTSHDIVASFTSSDVTKWGNSVSADQKFATSGTGSACPTTGQVGTKSVCNDPQNITGKIPVGTLAIATPYNASSPLNLGTLALSSDGTYYTGSAQFQCIAVTDTVFGTQFKAAAQANTLTQDPATAQPGQPATAVTTINGENAGLTALALAPPTQSCFGNPSVNSYPVASLPTTSSNPAANPPVASTDTGVQGLGNEQHTIITGPNNQLGTATYNGTLTLNAPTSTAPGTYNGTILFTISD